jgi:hypothetical protein
LNNALKNLIYPEYASKPGDIPIGELIVVFDADMQVGPHSYSGHIEAWLRLVGNLGGRGGLPAVTGCR